MEINIANDNTYRIQFDLGKGGGQMDGGLRTHVSTYIHSKALLMDNGKKWRGK